MRPLLPFLLVLVVATAAADVRAAEPERVVVRNRAHTVAGTVDLSASAGVTLLNYLTRHADLALAVGYNPAEEWGFAVEGAWAFSGATAVAEAAASEVVRSDPASKLKIVDDFEDLWRKSWSAVALARWSPVYGKLNVVTELPVHFQAYLLGGAGVGGMERDSLVYCVGQPVSRAGAVCSPDAEGRDALTPLHETALKPLFVAGVGLRLFTGKHSGLRLELRDTFFQDEFRVGITRASAETDRAALEGGEPREGAPAGSPGLTHLVTVQLGAAFTF